MYVNKQPSKYFAYNESTEKQIKCGERKWLKRTKEGEGERLKAGKNKNAPS